MPSHCFEELHLFVAFVNTKYIEIAMKTLFGIVLQRPENGWVYGLKRGFIYATLGYSFFVVYAIFSAYSISLPRKVYI
jgi:hypothetical protein